MKRETEVLCSGNNYRHILSSNGGRLNTITPCAACKLLRRRCAQECPFSPYFSPHEPHKFASVHKVFGASNVAKMLMEVPESQRADAANSLVYEANLRLRDPVYGCMGAISALQHQLQTLQADLNSIRSEILKYKYRDAIIPSSSSSPHIALISGAAGVVVSTTATPPAAPPTPPHSQPPPLSLPPPPPSSSAIYSSPISSAAPEFNTISAEHISYFA
ncbi:LOB domain-containing protein 15-like [Momordica charantia]|uniref:LOB domain-containing protein 15-like n=1 Tax=Momordica charantia TaxID=3673 RepID=A0A6J1BWY3_MOMCH|nr:LOB domain-containing protein 15-like [Momordica charantia]